MTDFAASTAIRLDDRRYHDFVLASVEAAQRRIWVSMFIFDIRPARDMDGLVLALTNALVARAQLGVDVRVMTTGAVGTPDIDVANLASGLYLTASGVPVRRIVDAGDARLGSHAKFLISDDHAVVGSQNWTDDGFRLNIEDAIVLNGQAVDVAAQEFLRLWSQGDGMPTNVSN